MVIKRQFFIVILVLQAFLILAEGVNKRQLDSLNTIVKTASNDTVKFDANLKIIDLLMKADSVSAFREIRKLTYKLNAFSNQSFVYRSYEKLGRICYRSGAVERSKYYYNQGLSFARKKGSKEWKGIFYFHIADLLHSEEFSKQCLPFFDSAVANTSPKNEKLLCKLYMLKGRAHYDLGDYRSAMDNYILSQRYFEKNNWMDEDYGHLLHFIGSVFKRQDLLEKALEYYEKELKLGRDIGNRSLEAEGLYLSAGMHGEMGDLDKELECELKALEIYKELGKKKSIALMLGNISVNYSDRKNYKKAIEYCEQAKVIYEELNEVDKASWLYNALGNYYSKLGQYKNALDYFNKAIVASKKVETKQLLYQADIKKNIAFTYESMGNYKSAFYTYLDYRGLEDSLNNLDNKKYLNELEKKYDTEKKEKEIALLNKDKEVQSIALSKQSTQQKALIVGSLLVLIIAVISIVAFINNRKKSGLLSKQVNEINYQNAIIKEKNKDITDSILYAKRLQEAVFPLTQTLNNYFAESFVLFRPKDIVSGDFYWFDKIKDNTIIIVGDSTGHGVPGAFMSILGHNLLNQIILEEGTIRPADILTMLDKRVTSSLNKKGSAEEYNDGMDIGVCVINKKEKKLYYAGANRPLMIKRGDKLFDLKQNKFAIGGVRSQMFKVFNQHEIEYFENDVLYMFSDGYYDQFGGPNGKKFKFKQLQELLLANSSKPMQEQLDILTHSFENWKGSLEQVDDVCVVGVRI